ncbi:carboxypeptidase-like regulatory domain-containing protein [Belliella sp. R4-6]|uniref:Carboxypeptidase-like regulatory domain-containing protein n=1 Tax=Belliella alkalica TaxID=1730871 RepID=A0ABS9VFD5_9BACT|nr:carboxypeptidase-like regulatory domain-containing protein [Belliella alkalica]MCH7414655.1 carboxypeptidase-like regulatory domain-containing protein [Belliella alkalica]
MTKYNSLIAFIVLFTCISCENEQFGIDKFGSISGTVVDGETYLPLSGVMISTSPSSTTMITDSTGNYSFQKIKEGDVVITARKNEYLTQSINIAVFSEENTISTFFLLKDERNIGNVLIFDPVPGNGSVNQPLSQTFTWAVEQQNRNIELTYNVFLFESNSSSQITAGDNLSQRSVVVSNLKPNTTYFWYVVARADGRNVGNSPTWSFRTEL